MAWGIADLVELLQAQGLTVRYDPATPAECIVALAGDDLETPHPTTVRLVTPREGQHRMLGLDTVYPFEAPDHDAARLAAAALDPYLLLGHAEVDDDSSVHFRYAMVVDVGAELPAAVLLDTVSVVNYEQMNFGDYLEAVCVRGFPASSVPDLVAAGEAAANPV